MIAHQPHVRPRVHDKYLRLIDAAQKLTPVVTVVAHPCDEVSLEGVVDARKLGLIDPVLIGPPPARIADLKTRCGADIDGIPIVEAAHSHDSAVKAVALVREGKAEALMKGSLHTDERMCAVVVRDNGMRTERRLSHCFVMDVPGHFDPLIITDAAVNIAPTLADKVDIVQNAIDLARAVGFLDVRVAILSAMETVNPKVVSTIEAAALCKMAERGQITGALLDGPLALDNAVSPEAAAIEHIISPVAGRANVLVVPDLEAGNMLAKKPFISSGGGQCRDRLWRAHPSSLRVGPTRLWRVWPRVQSLRSSRMRADGTPHRQYGRRLRSHARSLWETSNA